MTVLLAIFIVLMMGIFTENISPYTSVSDLKTDNTQNKNVQLYGQVILDTIFFNNDSGKLPSILLMEIKVYR